MSKVISIRRGFLLMGLFLLGAGSVTLREAAGIHQQATPLKVAVDLVSLNVTALDKKGRIISDLQRDDFKVYEDGVEQPISFFSSEQVPASWGLILDRSGSMELMIREVREAALSLIHEGSPADDMLVIPFHDRAALPLDFTRERSSLVDSIAGLYPAGQTALYDAVALALQRLQRGQHPKKVLVVITDGEDNSSRIRLENLIERVWEERDVAIYPIGTFESTDLPWWRRKPRGQAEKLASLKRDLQKLAEITGTTARFPKDIKEGRHAAKEIVHEVGRHYGIGYYPGNRGRDGRWRRIKVEVFRRGRRDTGIVARTRTGYYAAGD